MNCPKCKTEMRTRMADGRQLRICDKCSRRSYGPRKGGVGARESVLDAIADDVAGPFSVQDFWGELRQWCDENELDYVTVNKKEGRKTTEYLHFKRGPRR